MHIKRARFKNLNGKLSNEFHFHRDINVITGINGSGKTTFLKLLWYTISSNIERVIPELDFEEFELETSLYCVSIFIEKGNVRWRFSSGVREETGAFMASATQQGSGGCETINQILLEYNSSSVFFPTFRRIEGGYSMANTRRVRRRQRSGEFITEIVEDDEIQQQFDGLSHRLSVHEHKFVCSISTHDIVSLLTNRYATVAEKINEGYRKFSTDIIAKIQSAQSGLTDDAVKASEVLLEIKNQAATINQKRDSLLKPFSILNDLSAGIFKHKGIKLRSVTLGETSDAIDSSALSAGEKQMLSFLSYNSFFVDAPFFIDEPELSLHPDWQRRLFPILLKQQSSNQFVIATHSPFIYSKYQDKELCISGDKGE
jgi:ABC-type lipoprotein export system ATPase subunit